MKKLSSREAGGGSGRSKKKGHASDWGIDAIGDVLVIY